jgi:nucleotide-binding universal stress UspA family protein
MQAGLPVLVGPRTANKLIIDRMAVAWKDTREARRAVADALPLLGLAKHVTVLELTHGDERKRVTEQLVEVCGWLKTHNIVAEPKFVALTKGQDSYHFNAIVQSLGVGIVVAGAYDHSRLREWALGGVTRDMTLHANYCAMRSH